MVRLQPPHYRSLNLSTTEATNSRERAEHVSRGRVIAGSVAIGVLAAAALRGMARRFEIKEASMAPTLEPGDWVVAKRRSGVPKRGDIVVFTDPTGSGLNLTKRVIGLPGELITVEGGVLSIDGAILADGWAVGATAPDGEWEVPNDRVWVLGDNRGTSRADGRMLGPTPIEDLDWKIMATYWPKSRIRSIG